MVDLGRFDEGVALLRREFGGTGCIERAGSLLVRDVQGARAGMAAAERFDEVRTLVDEFRSLGVRRDKLNDAMSPMRYGNLGSGSCSTGRGCTRTRPGRHREAVATPVPGDLESQAGLDYTQMYGGAGLKTGAAADARSHSGWRGWCCGSGRERGLHETVCAAGERDDRQGVVDLENWDELASVRENLTRQAMNVQREEP